mmetsp:Transcript_4339/g.10475  ORF Transcript_4339/g.10475 Transcript_4339/m.10475 type:complete len:513 (-) Transcript_4339:187-1725(-)
MPASKQSTPLIKRSPHSKTRTRKKPHVGFLIGVVLLIVADGMYFIRLTSQAIFGGSSLDEHGTNHHSPYNLFRKGTHLLKLGDRLAARRETTTKGHVDVDIDAKMDVTTKGHDEDTYRKTPTADQLELIRIAKENGLTNVDDKGPILEILLQAGLDLTKKGELDQETLDKLPTWTQVETLYGPKPVIVGLERCEEFRNSIPATTRFLGMAGTFNTGTNLIHAVMKHNCQITERMEAFGAKSKGIRWQVPWGKHYMARYSGSGHFSDTDTDVPHDHTMALVSIRDPYSWMQSMCRHTYAAKWPYRKKHCPNLIATDEDIENMPVLHQKFGNTLGKDNHEERLIPVRVKYSKEVAHEHSSLAHFYSDWYSDYLGSDIPRVVVRFEDLLFHGEEVARAMCECGGGVPVPDNERSGKFVHVSESAKTGPTAHGPLKDRTNLVGALIKYGSFEHRTDNMTPDDLEAARRYLDPEIMEKFGYRHPPSPEEGEEGVEMGKAATESGRYDDDHSVKPKKK